MTPDNPGDRRDLLEPDDPGDRRDLLEPDDPGDRRDLLEPDDPGGCGPRRLGVSGYGERVWSAPVRSASVPVARPAPRTTGFLIVSLSPFVPLTNASSLAELAKELDLKGLEQVLKRFHNPPTERGITTPRAGEPCAEDSPQDNGYPSANVSLADLERRAARSVLGPKTSLRRFWRVACPTEAPRVKWKKEAAPESGLGYSVAQLTESFLEQLKALSEVDWAYLEYAASDPTALDGVPSPEEFANFQLYLDPSPLGLDARWARSCLNGTRAANKVAVADLEQGWILDHEDLDQGDGDGGEPGRPEPIRLIHGVNRHSADEYQGNHGAAVLSELAAKNRNGLGIVGIAAGASRVVVASHYCSEGATKLASNSRVADAIVALITGDGARLKAGDVLLLEVQRAGLPTSFDAFDFAAIQLAVANGIIVVEAAGNGGIDLDRLPPAEDGRSFNRRHEGFRDSGSIMVGAARAALPHNRAHFSNFGSRIDCFGWGNGVVAAGYGDFLGGETEQGTYTDQFSGTSAAAPMIAGAAVLVQSLYQENAAPEVTGGYPNESWRRLSPRQMRALLSNPRNGTPQGPGVPGYIGVMPDLRAILAEDLGVVPTVYLRDHEGDTGQTPYRRRLCASPDIIVTGGSAGIADFGEGSGTENHQSLGLGLAMDETKHLFVRVRNRGLQPAKEARVTVFSAPISMLVTPDRWTQVGEVELPGTVPQGDTLVVGKVGELRAGIEDCCLVAVVEHRGGVEVPVKCHASHFNWRKHLAVLRNQGNVAVRNVHMLKSGVPCAFKINGTPDAPRAFEFEVIQRLPSDVTVQLRAQAGLALKFSQGRLWTVRRDPLSDDEVILHLPKQQRFRLGTVTLPAGIDFPCQLVVTGGGLEAGHSLAIRQLYRGEEVGRITWRSLRPSKT